MQPLLEIIRACLTSKDFTTLGERTQGIYKNKLCSIKEVCRYLGQNVNPNSLPCLRYLFVFLFIQHPELSASYVESIHVNIEFLLKQAIKGELSKMQHMLYGKRICSNETPDSQNFLGSIDPPESAPLPHLVLSFFASVSTLGSYLDAYYLQ